MLKVPATVITLVLAGVSKHQWFRPLLIANSLTGWLYHSLEWRCLERYGMTISVIGHIDMRKEGWFLLNVAGHGFLPWWLYRDLNEQVAAPFLWMSIAAISAYSMIDFHSVYPTTTLPFEVYMVTHAMILCIASALC